MDKTRNTNQLAEKTILLVGGDKGGVGKSTIARAVADYLEANSVTFLAYDGDDANPTFLRFFKNATRICTKTIKGFEPLINGLEAAQTVQLVDLGAGTSITLSQFAEATGFVELAHSLGARIVLLFALAPSSDSIALLKTISERYGSSIQYVIAKSNAIPGTWDLWEGSKTRKRLVEEGAVEIEIPALDAEAYSRVDTLSLRWLAASTDKQLPLASRAYIHRWREKVLAELGRANLFSR